MRFFEARDQISQGAVVNPAAVLSGGDRQTDREVRLSDAGQIGDILLTNRTFASPTLGILDSARSWR